MCGQSGTATPPVTDRAWRYRARACAPPGPAICALCGSRGPGIEIGHIDGHEEHGEPQNLIWTCRACNVRCAHTLHAAGLGRPTRQFNPGAIDERLVARARAGSGGGRIHRTEALVAAYRAFGEVLRRRPEDREIQQKFYDAEARLRAAAAGRFNPAGGARSLSQWVAAALTLKGGSNAMPPGAAVNLIRGTPPARRSEFAQQIWRRRRARYGPTGRTDSVPF